MNISCGFNARKPTRRTNRYICMDRGRMCVMSRLSVRERLVNICS